MGAGAVIAFVCYVGTALFMVGIGVVQLKSKNPVGFYSGEEPPKASELSDVEAWNKKHGAMWLIYGCIILISYCIGAGMLESLWCLIPMCGGVFVPIPVMIWYHHRLIRKYKCLYTERQINRP